MPISRKDAALNSLVNFENLKEEKKKDEDGEKEYKPLFIKPGEETASGGFVPQAAMPTSDLPNLE